MKLGEALAERADVNKRVEQLRSRIVDNAVFQEGETPAENAAVLLDEALGTVQELEAIVTQINRTNALVTLDDGTPLAAALAHRDALRLRHSLLTTAADAATNRRGYARQLRSELRTVSALPVDELREQAADVAREIRMLDGRIQTANWTTDVVDV